MSFTKRDSVIDERLPWALPEGYATPDVSVVGEKRSFHHHLSLVPKRDEYKVSEKVRLILERLYSHARWELAEDFLSLETVGAKILALDRKSSPGYPACLNHPTNGDLIDAIGVPAMVSLVLDRVKALERGEKTHDPVRLFVKREPHKIAKVESGALRLIWSVSWLDQVIDSLLFDSSLEAEVSNYSRIPSKCGMNLHAGVDEFYRGLNHGISDDYVDIDKSRWDWTVMPWELNEDLTARSRLCVSPCEELFSRWLTLSKARYGLLQCSDVVFSDGAVYQQEIPGIMRSGSKITISANSRIQVLLKVCYAEDNGGFHPEKHAVASMGDDTVEKMGGLSVGGYEAFLNRWHVVKHVHGPGPLVDRVFCSAKFANFHGRWVSVPENYEKTKYNLKCKEKRALKFQCDALSSACLNYVFHDEAFAAFSKALTLVSREEGDLSHIRSREYFRAFHTLFESSPAQDEMLSKDNSVLVPAPRLVGIEENPGPGKGVIPVPLPQLYPEVGWNNDDFNNMSGTARGGLLPKLYGPIGSGKSERTPGPIWGRMNSTKNFTPPPLVGVEKNPGPRRRYGVPGGRVGPPNKPKKNRKKRAKAKTKPKQANSLPGGLKDVSTAKGLQLLKLWKNPLMERSTPMFMNSGGISSYRTSAKGSFTLTTGFGCAFIGNTSIAAPITVVSTLNAAQIFSAGVVGTIPWVQQTAVASNFSSGRCIAAGLKWRCPIAMTTANGIAYVGRFTSATINDVMALSAATVAPAAYSHETSPSAGLITWRPWNYDMMESLTTTGVTTGSATTLTVIPYVVFSGMPANSIVYYEAVAHWEGAAGSNSLASLQDSAMKDKLIWDSERSYDIAVALDTEALGRMAPLASMSETKESRDDFVEISKEVRASPSWGQTAATILLDAGITPLAVGAIAALNNQLRQPEVGIVQNPWAMAAVNPALAA